MNSNINTNIDFGSNNSSTNTSNSIGATSNTNSPTYTNSQTYGSNVQTESMDLSFATEQVAIESKSLLDKIGDFFSDIGEGLKNTGAKLVEGTKTVANWAISGIKELGSNINEACTNLASNVKSILGSTLSWAKDTYISLQSTATVIGTTVVSGLADIGEGIVDGLTWCGGKVVEGGSWLVGKVAGWFSDDAEESVMEWRDQAKTDVKEFIATDWVGEANDWFYQETALGRYINENSYLKYDSEAMQKLRGASEMVGKLVIATAATVLTAGTAAPAVLPLLLGFTYGVGDQAEKVYQENPNTTGAQELGIFVSGLGEAANWYAQGKLGEAGWKFLKYLNGAGIKNTSAKALKHITSSISEMHKNGFINTIKSSKIHQNGYINTIKGILKSSNWGSLKAADNLADSAGIVADNLSDWLVGNEEFNIKTATSAGGELLAAWALNMFFDGAGDYLGKLGKQGDNIVQNADIFSADDASSLGSHFDDFTTGKTGTYGVDQAACRRMTFVERLNNDWLTDPDDFRKFLREKYVDWPESEIDDALKVFTENDRLSEVGKNNVIEYLQKNNPDYQAALDKFNASFKAGKSPDYDRILNKYIKAGLSEEDAIYLLKSIDTVGVCSYAAVANNIAATFMDNPQLFKETFGYDLFTMIDGKQVLNSSELLSDLYIYANLDTNGGKLFNMVDGKLSYLSKDFTQQTYLSGGMYTRDDIIDGFLKSKSPDFGYSDNIKVVSNYDRGILMGMTDSTNYTVDDVKKSFDEVLADGNSVQLGIYRTPNNKFTFYNMDGTVHVTTNSWNEGGGHAVFVTGMTDEGIIVSSWGEKLLIKYEDFINNRYNIAWGQITGVNPGTASDVLPTTGTAKVITDGVGDQQAYEIIDMPGHISKSSAEQAKMVAEDYVSNLELYQSSAISIEDQFRGQGIEVTTVDSRLMVSQLFDDPKSHMFSITENILSEQFGLKPSIISKITNNPNVLDIKNLLRKSHIPESQIEEIVKLVNFSGIPNYKIDLDDFYSTIKKYMDDLQTAQLDELIKRYKEGYVGKMLSNATEQQRLMVNLYTTTEAGYQLINSKLSGTPLSESQLKKISRDLNYDLNYDYDLYLGGKSYDEKVNQLIEDAYKATYGTTEGFDLAMFNPTELQKLITDNPIPQTIVVSRIGYDFGGLKKKKELKVGKTLTTDGFLSVAGSSFDANKFILEGQRGPNSIRIDIIIPEGSNAAFIEPLSGVSGYYQNEVLLGPNSVLTIVEPARQEKIDGKQLITVVKCILTGGK